MQAAQRSRPPFRRPVRSNCKNVLLFGRHQLINPLNPRISSLLHLVLIVLLHILGKTLFLSLLQSLDCVATGIADNNLCALSGRLSLLDELLAALFGQWRNSATDCLSIV